MIFSPLIEGTVSIQAPPPAFLSAFRRRVEHGLLSGRPHSRSNYAVTVAEGDRLRVSAVDWRTAFNVGLNQIELQASQAGQLQYRIAYRRWASYAVALGAGLAAAMIVVLLSIDLRAYIENHPGSMFPGLSVDRQVLVAWAMVAFWGFVWPWLMIAFHKRPLRRLFGRIVSEVDASALEGSRSG